MRLERGQVARQIDDNVALLPVHRVELDAELRAVVIRLAAAVSGHRSHACEFCLKPSARAAASTSLSPRPEQFTITICSRFILGAFLTRLAIACAVSSAGIIPSVSERMPNALSASSSVA